MEFSSLSIVVKGARNTTWCATEFYGPVAVVVVVLLPN